MKTTIREDIEKEAFRICNEAKLKKGRGVLGFTLIRPGSKADWLVSSLEPKIYYDNPATISFLEIHGLLIVLNKNYDSDVRVIFNWEEIDIWIKNILGEEEQDNLESEAHAHCDRRGKFGFIVFEKPKKDEIKIGLVNTKQFRLLEKLEPFGIMHNVDNVFDEISNTYDEIDYEMHDPQKKVIKQKAALGGLIKELQRGTKLKGRISLSYSKDKRQVRLVLRP